MKHEEIGSKMANETTFRRWLRTGSSEVWVLQDDEEATVGQLHLHYGEAGRALATLCVDQNASDDDVGHLLGVVHEQLLKQDGRGVQELAVHVWRGRHEQYAYQAQEPATRRTTRKSGTRKKPRRS